jgi:hypothetical protein
MHPSAWKGNSPKSVYSIVHKPSARDERMTPATVTPRVQGLYVVVLDRYARWCVSSGPMPNAPKEYAGRLANRKGQEHNREDTDAS